MRAMILAAGRGERLRPLTDTTPKPLIKVAGKTLIEYHLNNLAKAGFKEIIINTAWLAEKIHKELEDGSKYSVSIQYSDEGEALETAGGIIRALPLLGEGPFLVINGDIWCDYDFTKLPELAPDIQAHLILVDNPEHNPEGDFSIQDGQIKNTANTLYTFSGIGLYRRTFFAEQGSGPASLAPIIRKKCDNDLVSGEHYSGIWTDVGTLERLKELENQLR
ncbi:MAG TPA: nucleotidyltransferase family protein [Gammaproteobacteria bacterium]|nr:nucleotidyltransferase family protein [Gammaproteobacteria bacterium]